MCTRMHCRGRREKEKKEQALYWHKYARVASMAYPIETAADVKGTYHT